MNLVVFDDPGRENLFPFTLTRPAGELRVGMFTIKEKWEQRAGLSASFITEPYLVEKYPFAAGADNLLVNGRVLPDAKIWSAVEALDAYECLVKGDVLIAMRLNRQEVTDWRSHAERMRKIDYPDDELKVIHHIEDLIKRNGDAIVDDFDRLGSIQVPETLRRNNGFLGDAIFFEENSRAELATFNSTTGPIYIGKNVQIMEGAHIRGPFAALEGSIVKMGAKIYGGTTLGPHCTVGGEIKNSIMLGFSNKAHDGYLGDSVLGENCNLGAGTSNSNMKNNYRTVKLYRYADREAKDTGLQFCGLFAGDHMKSGINSSFNTGTVVGTGANVFGTFLTPNFIADFTWMHEGRPAVYLWPQFLASVKRAYLRKNRVLTPAEEKILSAVYEFTKAYRNF